jgi:hypothetical protein
MDYASFVQIITSSGFLKKIRIKELRFLDISNTSKIISNFIDGFLEICGYIPELVLCFLKQ